MNVDTQARAATADATLNPAQRAAAEASASAGSADQTLGRALSLSLRGAVLLALWLCLSSGLRIAADRSDAFWRGWLEPLLMQGEVLYWHLLGATLLCALSVGTLVYLWQVGRWRWFRRILRDCFPIGDAPQLDKIGQLPHYAAAGFTLLAVLSGALIYLPSIGAVGAPLVLHRGIAWVLLLYCLGLFVLLLRTFSRRGLDGEGLRWPLIDLPGVDWPALLVRLRGLRLTAAQQRGLLFGLGAFCLLMGLFGLLGGSAVGELPVQRVRVAPTLDGVADDAVWQRAKAVTLYTTTTAGTHPARLPVTLRALTDDRQIWMLFEWPDSTRSLKHMPMVKGSDGWQLYETRYREGDEPAFHEDALAVMFSHDRLAARRMTQLGPRPHPERPAPASGRGLHYSTDAELADLWYWGAVRSAPARQLDDLSLGAVTAPRPGQRYRGGLRADPDEGGGYRGNFELLPGRRLVIPRRIPRDPGTLQRRVGDFNADYRISDSAPWIMRHEDTRPYSAERDQMPEGSVIPSLSQMGPFRGDRGDVRAVARWDKGYWRLEVSRPLRTGSTHDLVLGDGVYLWVAVFDHAQGRHSRHLHPLRLSFDR